MLRLVDGAVSLELDDPAAGYAIQSVEFAAPSTRDNSANRPGADGTIDQTAFVGARAITVNLEIIPDPSTKQDLVDQVSRFLHPRLRLDMHVITEPDGPERVIRVRPDQFSAPWERPHHVAMSIGFKTVGSPFLYGVTINEVSIAPMQQQTGRTYDLSYPRIYPGSVTSAAIIHNAGDQPAQWTARIYGPVTGPRIRNETLGLEVSFPTLTIPAGSYVDLSSEDRTVLADGVTSRYSTLDFLNSTWWLLAPGDNAITMPTSVHDVPAQADLSWLDTYLI